ncbi:MAG: GlsB/YeaQ/YmgE family stress response membrane protein [Anaerovoracaceae bacterium]|jgi:uncharacterized membrane protein YeaQ/YmgE (transglycosylase-associated protein family)
MGLIAWLVVGALAGWIAGKLMKDSGNGLLGNIIVGIIGALIGGFVMNFMGFEGVTGFNLWSILVAVFGACILLFLLNAVRKKQG